MSHTLYRNRELEAKRKHFINSYPPFNIARQSDASALHRKRDLALYVHIPFCPTICTYCFYKTFRSPAESEVDVYLSYLEREIELFSRQPGAQERRVRTLYIGGGTPTVLNPAQLRRLVSALRSALDFSALEEFCCEMMPHEKTANYEKLETLKELGVHRISFGVESFNQEILRDHNRHCTPQLYDRTYAMVRDLGFEKINIDLMSGLPGETWSNWRATIDKVLDWRPPSVSIYKTEVFYNTNMFTKLRNGKTIAPMISDEEEIEHIQYAHDELKTRGAYIVANCLHLVRDWSYNTLHYTHIWDGMEMKGLGLSAHSCYNGALHQNSSEIVDYYGHLDSGLLPVKRAHEMSARDFISQAMVYGIKNLAISRARFVERFGVDLAVIYTDVIHRLLEAGAVTLDDEWLRVTPQYYIFADDVARLFFLPEYENMMLSHIERPARETPLQVVAS